MATGRLLFPLDLRLVKIYEINRYLTYDWRRLAGLDNLKQTVTLLGELGWLWVTRRLAWSLYGSRRLNEKNKIINRIPTVEQLDTKAEHKLLLLYYSQLFTAV